jgi:ankyrin repeat protein/Tfp pilus assembly protein PilF
MEPFTLATACSHVISTCIKLSRRLNQVIEDGRNVDDFSIQALQETQCLYKVLRSIHTTVLNNPASQSFLTTRNDASGLREALGQAISGSGAAVARFETILNGVMPSPKALSVARKALASQNLRGKTSELLHIRQQMQTYTGILQMALQTITVSLLLQNAGSAVTSPTRLTSKVNKLVRSINNAEQNLAFPRAKHLDPQQVAQFGICTKSAHAVVSSANSVLGHTQNPRGRSGLPSKSETTIEWGFTFLDIDITEPPVARVALTNISRTEAWITERPPSEMIEPDTKSAETSAPPSDVHQDDGILSAPHEHSRVYWDDSNSCSSSEDEMDLDLGLYLVFMDLGDQSLAEDHFSQAETYFRKALDRVQNFSTQDRRLIKQKIGVACLEQGKYDEAKAIFDEHPDLARSIIERIATKARAFYDQGEYQYAINCLQRALTDAHDAPADAIREMRMLFGLAYFSLKEFAKAGNQFSQVLLSEDRPDSRALEAHHWLALVHLRQAEFDQAIEHAQTACKGRWRLFSKEHATSQESLVTLINAFESKGDMEDAKAYTKLLTEDNLKVGLHLHKLYSRAADKKQKRVMQSRFVALRTRFAGLRKRDRILTAMDDDLFASEVETFIKHVLTPEDGDTQGVKANSSLLLVAAQEGRSVIVRALLRVSKLDIRAACDNSGDTALHIAVRNGAEEIAILLLRQMGTGVNLANGYGETALAIATRNRNESMIKLLLKDTRINPNLEIRKKRESKIVSHGPALHIAIINKADSIVDLIIRHASNLDLNYRDAQGRTPFHYALLSGNAKICEILLQQPAIRLNSVTEPEKQSLLSLAIINDMPKLAHQLIYKREVDTNIRDHQGHAPLHHSAWCSQPLIMEHLLQRRSLDLNLKDLCGRSALHIAAANGNVKLVKQLIADSRTDFCCKTNYGETPLDTAKAANFFEIAKILEGRHIQKNFNEYLL